MREQLGIRDSDVVHRAYPRSVFRLADAYEGRKEFVWNWR
jgi:hypothetical protein